MSNDPLAAAVAHLATLDPADADRAIRRLRLEVAAALEPVEATPLVRTMGEFWDTPVPEVPVLVGPGVLVRGALTVTAGRAGKGKTQMNLNRCMRWAAGKPWFDDLPGVMEAVRPLKIVVIENEGAGTMFHRDTLKMYDNADFEGKEIIRDNLLVWGDGGYSGLKLDREDHVKLIMREAIEKHEPDVLFMEPFRGLFGGNENDSGEVSRVLQVAEQLAADYQIAILLAHHETKSPSEGDDMNALRGSGAFEGTAAVIEHHKEVVGGKYRELSCSKSRYAPKPPPIRMTWNGERYWYEHVSESAATMAVLGALTNTSDPMTVKDLADETGETQRKIRDTLNKLLDEGKIKKARSAPGEGVGFRLLVGDNHNNGEKGGLGVV